jgi:hypothetical protein
MTATDTHATNAPVRNRSLYAAIPAPLEINKWNHS